MSTLTLNDGASIPLLAYGTGTTLLKNKRSRATGGDPMALDRTVIEHIKTAIRLGYRHLDTAEMYQTEPETRVAINESIAEGIVKREDLFVTTKISSNFTQVQNAIDASLKNLGLAYVDLYLLHSPYWTDSDADLQRAWKDMEAVKESGKARSIGVSNYSQTHLSATLATARIPPSINQIEFHPYMRQGDVVPVAFSHSHSNIATSAYGALAPVTRNIPGPLDQTLESLAKKYGVSTGLICLRWCIDQDIVVITTSEKETRMKEYLTVFDFKLTDGEVQEISDRGTESVGGKELVPRVIRYYRSLKEKDAGGKAQ
ncbi:alcohol dehydrogenase [Capronia coronata CBS 617.96]|uniref:D-xylose reductase [NAD(P)H] n=1 Tax=Capronia coronata CBS 617.96 TaxID=1182541 RepID=W9XSX0_9EURO|nr:alcohol dehydrogenase [Capronia coronata CBS 617.96]EXJ80420.1 alcohol dehydrogenase [Capronia coronata CBS 617.96]